jgi:peptidoglycan hydrolase-like protein with peptidoglycan-binding domain
MRRDDHRDPSKRVTTCRAVPRLATRMATAIAVVALAVPAVAQARVSGTVAALQVALRASGDYSGSVDGVRGPGTRAGVRRFQAHHHLTVDGVVGAHTRRAMGRRGRPGWGHRTMTLGNRGWDVAHLQFELARHGFPNGGVDGGFGPHVQAALERFQTWAHLTADGAAGPATRRALAHRPPQSPLKFYRPLGVAAGDGFGPRGATWHPGIDFPAASGTPVGAAGRGCVSFAGYDSGGYGNLVIIQHRLGVTTMYGHLSSIAVHTGECVVGHNRIGRVGSTGFSTGPHLHFEIRVRGAAVNPARAFL